jgi:2'-5' RNA ligase
LPSAGPGLSTERLFFALWPDDGVRARLADWSREFQARCGGHPTRIGNFHLTLAFLGAVDPVRMADIVRAAETIVPRAATLVLDRPGYWKHNRIAWAGASRLPPALDALVAALRGALVNSGIAFDSKAFVPHVTLVREARAPLAMPVLAPIEWHFEDFALAASVAAERGSRYEIRKSWR